ncbi:hypothetical protein [Pseudomonas sp. URMO17WK12:I11]|uniref:hypothetical protein n=1 Tax=Pseudomonas sp. URMO17WK12:I11 TaxID=1283291 RepID=UPI00071FDD4C|nr:hypothetical protein [Pseudomonas sp. URMO17WK12:I11]CRL51647.1 hypothetical protein PSHI_48400 [Pseudomonas sp. URMO17WK12:I11]
MFGNKSVRHLLSVCAVSLCSAGLISSAGAQVTPAVFGEPYRSMPAVAPSQSQVIYYQLGVPVENASVAHIYVDGEFHAALLPGGYTTFCLDPGEHGLNAAFNDSPGYTGKHEQPGIELKAGETLFLRADEQFGPLPVSVSREVAEKEMVGTLRQVHVKSRATAVKACLG